MANPRKRPTPAERMAELLAYERRRLLRSRARAGLPEVVTAEDFEAAWEECWAIMVAERAWPHLTRERVGWRQAQLDTKPQLLQVWLGRTTAFDLAVEGIRERSDHSHAAVGTDR